VKVRFIERHGNALLAEPLRLEGFVTLTGDGALIRQVEQPFAEMARLDGASASIERNGRQRRISLGSGRRGVYLRTLYALLSGDVDAVQQAFDPSLEGRREAWTLTLTPRAAELARLLKPVTLSGAGDRVTVIRITRNDGAWQEFQLAGPAP
jgi:hypothetical protein